MRMHGVFISSKLLALIFFLFHRFLRNIYLQAFKEQRDFDSVNIGEKEYLTSSSKNKHY